MNKTTDDFEIEKYEMKIYKLENEYNLNRIETKENSSILKQKLYNKYMLKRLKLEKDLAELKLEVFKKNLKVTDFNEIGGITNA